VSENTSGTIHIIQATYGRTDRVACVKGIPWYQTLNTRCRRTVTNTVSHL